MYTGESPLDLGEIAMGIDALCTAVDKRALKLITDRIKDGVLGDEYRLSKASPTRLGVFSDLGPDHVQLYLFVQGEVVMLMNSSLSLEAVKNANRAVMQNLNMLDEESLLI